MISLSRARAFVRATGLLVLILAAVAVATPSSAQFPPPLPQGPSTTTIVSSSGGTSQEGDSVTFTATVTSFDIALTPEGSVTFSAGSLIIGTASLVNGVASVTTSTLPFGTLTITATYSGDTKHLTSSGTVDETVTISPPTVIVTADYNQVNFGDTVTFTATVTGSGPQPSGSVTFLDGNMQTLGSVTLVNGGATFATASLPVGTQTITAAYSGDQTYPRSAGTVTQTVLAVMAAPSVTIYSSKSPAAPGESVTFTATVTGSAGTPTGSIVFSDGQLPLTSVNLDGNGTATFTTSSLALGQHTIEAYYAGDTSYSSGSNTVTQDIAAAPVKPTISIVSDKNPSAPGDTVTFTATVTGSGAQPTGTVYFEEGKQSLGSASLVGGVATFSTAALAAGSHNIDAIYGGDSTYGKASATVTQTVGAAPPPPATTATLRIRSIGRGERIRYSFGSMSASRDGGDFTVPAGTTMIMASPGSLERVPAVSCSGTKNGYQVSISAGGSMATVIFNLQPGDDVTCTFTVESNTSAATIAKTTTYIASVSTAAVVASSQTATLISSIGVSRLTGGFTSSTSIGQLMSMFPMAENGGPVTIQGSLGALNRQIFHDTEQKRFDAWFQARWQGVKAGTTEGSLVAGVVGADYLVTPKLLVGAFAAIDQGQFSFGGTGKLKGTGWIAGGYAAMKLSDRLFLDGAIAAGTARNAISPLGTYTDGYSTVRFLASTSLTGSWQSGAWTFVPTARLFYAMEKSAAYTDSLGNAIPSTTTSLFQASAGPGFTYTFQTEGGVTLEPGISFDGLARVQATSGGATTTTFYGRVEPSLSIRTEAGLRLDLQGNLELGRDYLSYGGTAKLTYAFD